MHLSVLIVAESSKQKYLQLKSENILRFKLVLQCLGLLVSVFYSFGLVIIWRDESAFIGGIVAANRPAVVNIKLFLCKIEENGNMQAIL